MKRLLSFVVCLVLCMGVWGKPWTPETLPIPANTFDSTQVSYVTNPDGILSRAQVDSINAVFFAMEKNQGVRGLVIVVKEIDPDDPYEFTFAVANKHGIGGKHNTGVVVMLATESRAYSILTGDGMEKFLTDAQCDQIERHVMVPLLKEGRWGEAVYAACQKVGGVVSGETVLTPDSKTSDGDGGSDILLWMGLGVGGLVGAGAYTSRKRKECPKCKKHNYKFRLRQTVVAEGQEGAPTAEEAEDELQAKLLAMRIQKNREMVAAVKSFCDNIHHEVSPNDTVEQTEAEEAVVEENAADTRFTSLLDGVKPEVATAALKIVDAKKAFNSEKKNIKPSQLRSAKGQYRKLRITDVYCCPDCGYEGRKQSSSWANVYALGLFTSGSLGLLNRPMHGARGGGSVSIGSGGSHSGGGHSSGGHSWGSSGGGHFSGGGASGRF